MPRTGISHRKVKEYIHSYFQQKILKVPVPRSPVLSEKESRAVFDSGNPSYPRFRFSIAAVCTAVVLTLFGLGFYKQSFWGNGLGVLLSELTDKYQVNEKIINNLYMAGEIISNSLLDGGNES